MELSLSDAVVGRAAERTILPTLKPLQFGVIGYGYWGPQLVRNLSNLAGSSVEFIADLDTGELARAHRYHQSARLTQRADDLFKSDIDAMIIATPVHTHYALARQALLAGKHVFVEKPLAGKVSEVEELIHLAQEGNCILMVGYTFLYHTAVQELRHILTAGQLGKLYYVDTQRLNLGLFHQDVNVIWDLAPHDLSMLRYLLDADPVSVRTTGAAHIQCGIHDVAYIHLRYADGMIAHMQLSWLHPSKVRRLTLVGDQRMAVYDDVEPHDKIRIYNRGVDRLPHSTTFEEFELSYRTGEIVIPPVGWKEPLQAECEHFVECIRSGKQPLSDGVWSLPITRALEAIQRSLELDGQEVSV